MIQTQVISRAHRMGARGAVTVERLVMRNTAEQALDELNASAVTQAAALREQRQQHHAQKLQHNALGPKGGICQSAAPRFSTAASAEMGSPPDGIGGRRNGRSNGSSSGDGGVGVGVGQAVPAPTDERGVNNVVFLRLRKVDVDALASLGDL